MSTDVFVTTMNRTEKQAWDWINCAWVVGLDEARILKALKGTYSFQPVKAHQYLNEYKRGRGLST